MKDATATKNEHIAEQSMKEMEDNVMLKMKDATATKNEHIAEQSMKEMEDNATMITAPFIDHYHPEEILKVLTRTMMAINKKFMLLGKKILKKLEKAYFHDRSLVSEGFKAIAIPTISGATKQSSIAPDVISSNNDDLKNRPFHVVSEKTIFETNKHVEESGSDTECTLSSTPRPFDKLFRIVEEREQSMKEMEDNATMITAPFIDHYHPEEILKVLTRTMMAINKKFMLLGKKILKKLEKAYFHDRSLVSEGFKPIAIPTILGATKHSAIVPDVISRNNDDLKNRPIYVVSEQTIFEKNKNVEESGSDIECTLSSTPRPFNKLFRIVEEREAFFGAKKSISRYSLMKRISNIEEIVFGQTGNILCTVSLISRLDALTYFDTSKNRKLWVDVIAEMEDALDVVAPAGCHACERVERLERVIW
eukprot:CAMPEP_0172520500 /NCGR_PEP_ID=MMETSP1066-20121228/292046_1 /TAXON_ID=671091 /ORGANISM="Coscinodiscus wailesii, Strain CCMP2513" /LENGTH=421 /DNA_ID=CAMNT_0013303279 /DNA_START=431 /DNA_END=1693 /DNA_ORIENTATION=-